MTQFLKCMSACLRVQVGDLAFLSPNNAARPQSNNLLMEELATEKMGSVRGKKKKDALLNQAVGGLIILQVPF